MSVESQSTGKLDGIVHDVEFADGIDREEAQGERYDFSKDHIDSMSTKGEHRSDVSLDKSKPGIDSTSSQVNNIVKITMSSIF